MQVKKAVIPAAGLGTRFLPATKTVPKELLPIVDVPILLHIVREIVAAGIEDIVLVSGRGKTAIEDFFDTSYELEHVLKRDGKEKLHQIASEIKGLANIISIRQKQAKGLGHAVHTAKPVVGEAPFAVLLGDELMIPHKDGDASVTQQLARSFENTGRSTVAVMAVEESEVYKYGIIAHEKDSMPLKVTSVVEKPAPDKAPSRWALPGRYVFTAKIFDYLEGLPPGKNGEIQLTDGMTALAQNEGLDALEFSAQRFDAGDKFGYLQANIEMGLRHPEVGDRLKNYLRQLVETL